MREGKHVFISYYREDLPRIQKLAAIFERHRLKAWYDESPVDGRRLPKGPDYRGQINAAIDDAYAFVVVFSKHADARSRHGVGPEINRAITHHLQLLPNDPPFIFPLVLDGVAVPRIPVNALSDMSELEATQCFGSKSQQTRELRRLITDLQQIAGPSAAEDSDVVEEITPSKGHDWLDVIQSKLSNYARSAASCLDVSKRNALFSLALLATWFFLMWLNHELFYVEDSNRYEFSKTVGKIPAGTVHLVSNLALFLGLATIWIRKVDRVEHDADNADSEKSLKAIPRLEATNSDETELGEKAKMLYRALRDSQQREIGYQREVERLTNDLGTTRLSTSAAVILNSAILCSFCCWLASFVAQGYVQQFVPTNGTEPLEAIVFFSGSTSSAFLMLIAAFFFGYLAFNPERSRSRARFSFQVFCGAFVASMIWMLHLSPEVWAITEDPTNYQVAHDTYFAKWNLTLMQWMLANKVILLPVLGLIGSGAGAALSRRRMP